MVEIGKNCNRIVVSKFPRFFFSTKRKGLRWKRWNIFRNFHVLVEPILFLLFFFVNKIRGKKARDGLKTR